MKRGPYARPARSRIAAARQAAGLTQREAAARACLSLTVYQRAEWGVFTSARAARRLASVGLA